MSTNPAPREPMRRYVRDSNRRKVVRRFDLNAPPTDDSLAEGTSALTVNPQQEPLATAAGDGVFASPIDVEAIEDEVELLNSSSGFPQARIQSRRRHPMIVIDEDMEIHAGRSGIFTPNMTVTVSFNGNNKRERTRTLIDCEVYSTFQDDYNAKRKKVMNPPCVEPAKVVPKEPTFTCAVCLNELAEPCSTNCGHIFCQGCIKLAVQKQKKCPTCRRGLTMRGFHRVYLPTSTS